MLRLPKLLQVAALKALKAGKVVVEVADIKFGGAVIV